jgi:hypothetical protein
MTNPQYRFDGLPAGNHSLIVTNLEDKALDIDYAIVSRYVATAGAAHAQTVPAAVVPAGTFVQIGAPSTSSALVPGFQVSSTPAQVTATATPTPAASVASRQVTFCICATDHLPEILQHKRTALRQ